MDNIMDPELATEMVKLLGQELKVVRSQLREAEQRTGTPTSDAISIGPQVQREEALQAEILTLKVENASLRKEITRLQDQSTSVPLKMEGDHSDLAAQYSASMDAIQKELADAIREKNTATLDKEKADEQLAELTSVREKYRKLKASKRECQEVIDELRGQLELYIEEREHRASEAKVLKSDPPTFFRNIEYPTVGDQPNSNEIPIYSPIFSMGIPRTAKTHCRCDGTLRLERDVVMFARAGIAIGLIVRPTHQYNPQKNNGAWSRVRQDIELGQKKDLCYHDGHGWKYLGTYERTGESFFLSAEHTKKLSSPRIEAMARDTVLFKDLVPPSQMRMVERMYWDGVLQIEMFGIRRVTYDREFAKQLFEKRKDLPKNVKDVTFTNNKRKRDSETDDRHDLGRKKPSTSGIKEESSAS
jgi:cell division protein FtsB